MSETTLPATSTVPSDGDHSPLIILMRVDFPDPDSPMTTKVSPLATSKLTSMTAAVPREASSSRDSPALSLSITCRSFLPKTLYRWDARTKSTSYGTFRMDDLEITQATQNATASRHGDIDHRNGGPTSAQINHLMVSRYIYVCKFEYSYS